MNNIKSLLRNYKARFTLRIVSFFKAPYKNLTDKVYDHIQEDMSNILENTSDWRWLIEKVDDKLNTEDFDYELCQAYSFTELSDKVDELEANSDGDPFTDIDDESHPVSKLIDDRNEQIHSMIIELKDRLDIAEQNLAVKTEQMEKVYTKLKELKNFDTVLSAIKDLEAKLPTNG
jgi:DNA repair exonuclease SbcCD ATPase subunit